MEDKYLTKAGRLRAKAPFPYSEKYKGYRIQESTLQCDAQGELYTVIDGDVFFSKSVFVLRNKIDKGGV